MARLTDTQLVILSTASRRNDRGVDLPANVTGEAVRKAVDRLIRTGLLEEVRANSSLPTPPGGHSIFSKGTSPGGAAATDFCNRLLIPTKVAVKKPHRKPLINQQNYASYRWLFGPENAISVNNP